MLKRSLLSAVVPLAILAAPVPALGQSWSQAQQEVWTVVVESWDAIVAKDLAWTDKWVHPNAVVWGDDDPMPRTRASVKKWDGYEFQNSTTLTHEQSPAGIVVQGSTAVAHYYYSLGTETASGERRAVHGRCTDVLIRESGRWQFIAWRCGDSPSG